MCVLKFFSLIFVTFLSTSLHGEMYELEACRLNKSDISSLDFVVNRFFIKMFKTSNMEIVKTCQEHFQFRMPIDLVASHSMKLESDKFVR